MSNDEKKLGRRDTIKLATAVTALGAGLGVVLDENEALAGETFKLRSNDLGNLVLKFYKLDADGKTHSLLDTVDVGALALKMNKGGAYTVKMFNHKQEATVLIGEQALHVDAVAWKQQAPSAPAAPIAPASPIQPPATLKR